jgi:hypothetical protein
MSRVTTLVTGAASARQDGDDPLHVHTVYDPHRATLKIIVTGTAGDTATVLALIGTLTREQASRPQRNSELSCMSPSVSVV